MSEQITQVHAKSKMVQKLLWLLVVITILIYANTLNNDFVYDDLLVIKENSYVKKGLNGIPEILSTPYHKGFNNAATELYRPLSLAVFATVYQFFGPNPTVYHLLNILAFACCVSALFLFLHGLMQRQRIMVAFIASLLFALHPIHTEVVANCKSLDELLCFLFTFCSLNILMTYAETGNKKWLGGGAILFLLAFLSKETAVTFVAIIPFIFYVHQGGEKKHSLTILAAILLITGIAFALRYIALGSMDTSITSISFVDNPLADKNIAPASRLATAILILGKYLHLLIAPFPLSSDYSYNSIPLSTFADPSVLISLIVYIALILVCIIRLRKNANDMCAFAILFYLVTLSLFSNIVFLVGVNMAERFLFFPSVGFCLGVGLLIEWSMKQKRKVILIRSSSKTLAILALSPICILYAVFTIKRNAEWKDNLSLFTADAEKMPGSSRVNFMLGNELVKAGQMADAINYLQQAVVIYPEYAAAQLEMGKALYNQRDFARALAPAQKAYALIPNNTDAVNNLGLVYLGLQRYEEAVTLFRKVLQIDADNVQAHFNLGASYANLKSYELALQQLKTTIRLDPNYAEKAPYQYIARIYNKMGMPDSAALYSSR